MAENTDLTSLAQPGSSDRPLQDTGAFVPGTLLADRYRVVARLGRGGMGEVYRAEDLKLGQAVALKFLPAALERDPAALERLVAEVRMARAISHPHVCRVYDIGEVSSSDGARSFITMEYIDGEDLSSLLRRIGRLPPAKALEVARQLCAGLAAAHDKGVLHRDLKPANVMIDGRGHARIADFGIAVETALGPSANDHAGTLAYMAPERFAGKPATIQSDLYALGLILYETYTGKPPFSAATQGEWQRAHADSAPTIPSAIVTDIEPAVERVILRCLDKDPARRPSSAAQMAAALPGGDPLAAAIAAGETPSPELVAASGDEGTLPRAKAFLWLAAIIVLLATAIPLISRNLLINRVAMPLDTSALSQRARAILVSLGYSTPPVDWLAEWNSEPDATRAGRPRLGFAYRQAQESLFDSALGGEGLVQRANYEGDALVILDPEGRLKGLDIGGLRDYSNSGPAVDVNWAPLLTAIGASESPVPSTKRRWPPAFYADTRAAWTAIIAGEQVDVEAAALRGRVMSLRIRRAVAPDESWSAAPIPGLAAVSILTGVMFLLPLVLGVFAYRNFRAGRSDRRGAFRMAAFSFCGGALFRLVERHWNPELPALLAFGAVTAVMMPLVMAVISWIIYTAIEPFVRRRWPHLLIGWTRLLDGRLSDGLIGQALLIGVASGIVMAALSAAGGWVHELLGVGQPVVSPFVFRRGDWLIPIRGAAIEAMIPMGALVLCRIVFRRDWIAWTMLWLFSATGAFAGLVSDVTPLVALSEAAVFATISVWLLYRFGLLTFVVAAIITSLLSSAPLTLDTSRWYFWQGLLPVAIVLAFAVWGFKNVLGKQRLLPDEIDS